MNSDKEKAHKEFCKELKDEVRLWDHTGEKRRDYIAKDAPDTLIITREELMGMLLKYEVSYDNNRVMGNNALIDKLLEKMK